MSNDSLFSDDDLDQDRLEAERLAEKNAKKEEVQKVSEKKEFTRKLYIVDGYSLIYRSYFAFLSHPLTDGEGNNVSAYFGFFNTIFMLLREYTFDYFVIALDAHAPTFRHQMYPEYKANRDAAPEDLHAQVPRIVETLDKMNIPYILREGFEADDLIATLCENAKRLECDTVMVTGDKDLLQLVDDHVFALRPPRKGQPKYELYGAKEVQENYGVTPSQIVDYLSLIGDTADNVPGVKGIGEKGAVKLLSEYVSLDGIYRHLDSLPKGLNTKLSSGKESAYLSRELIVLKRDVFTLDTFDTPEFQTSTINYAAGVEEFMKAACTSLARTSLALAHGDKGAILNAAEEKVKDDNSEVRAPEHLLGVGEYKAVTSASALKGFLEDAVRCGGVIAFDTETTDIDVLKAELSGFSFSYEEKKAYYLPLVAGGKEVVPLDEVIAVLKEYFSSGRLSIVGQNLKYDIAILDRYGVSDVRIAFDTMIAAWLIDSNAGVYNLDELASRYLSYDTVRYEDVVPKGSVFSDIPLEDAVRYSGEDSDLAWRLYRHFSSVLEERGLAHLLSEYELPLIPVLESMERTGVLLDKPFMGELSEKLTAEQSQYAAEIYAEAGHEFNINSSQQLAKVLFEEKKLETGRKTQRGYSTDTATLEGLRGKEGAHIAELVLEYRAVSKLLSTYVDTLPSLCDENGRIHTSYLQTGTATGRLSSRNPNLQNIPIRTDDGRLIRNAFVPAPGCRFLSADYSQIELVVLAHVSEDAELRKAFIEGEDVHRYTASLIFSKSPSEVDAHERRIAKTINFGIMYGMSPFRLSNELGISRAQAKEFIDLYFTRYSGVKKFVADCVKGAEEKGYVTTMGGHVRVISGINSRNKNEKQAAERVAVNTVIQGTAAEIMKKAMLDVTARIREKGLKSRLLLQVHDEIIFEFPEAEEAELTALVRDSMENAVKLSIPLRSSIECGMRWGDMH